MTKENMKFDLYKIREVSETIMAVAIAVMLIAGAIILSAFAGYLTYDLFN